MESVQTVATYNLQESLVSEHAAYVAPAHHYLIQVCGDLRVSTMIATIYLNQMHYVQDVIG
jgi:hypothetical protein